MNHLSPYDYILGFASVTAVVSIIDMIDTLRLFILLATAVGTAIKLIAQIRQSKEDLMDVWGRVKNVSNYFVNIWNKLKTKK
jgi:hypothetical protein